MTKFMEKKNTPLDVQQNVKKYLNYNHNTAQKQANSGLLDQITPGLQTEIKVNIYQAIIYKCEFFKNFSEEFIK